MFFNGFLVLLAICTVNFVQAQQYVLDPQFHFQPSRDDFYRRTKPIQFQQQFSGFSGFDQYLPQRDLQTSDIPFHLQKTLPQYRFSSNEQLPKNELPFHNNIIFRPDHERTEQNVAPSTHRPNYSHFLSKNHNKHPEETETFLGQVTLDNSFGSLNGYFNDEAKTEKHNPIPDKLLREHTRILAPDPEEKQNKLQENKYFVNENGEVFSTTNTPTSRIFPLKKLSTKIEIEGEQHRNSRQFPRNNIIETDKSSYRPEELDQIFNSANNFDTSDYEYDDDHMISTLKMGKKVDSMEKLNDSTSQMSALDEVKNNGEKQQKLDNNLVDSPAKTRDDFGKPVVSVVTTKSVINNTIIATIPPIAPSTIEYNPTPSPPSIENTTDSWVVVASVQTSKSISGAHYLPSSIVAQDERFTLLNEKDRREEPDESQEASTEDYEDYDADDYENENTTEELTTQQPTKHSTESLIDKLDRVQSDLSSGLLTGGYKNEDNNIAVITENMTDKIHIAEMTEPSVTSQIFSPAPKTHFPVIKKFSPHARPPTSNLYPKRKPQPPRKSSTTTTTEVAVPIKDEIKSSTLPKITIAKADAFLPPGYKPPSENDNSSDLLAELLRKFKNTNDDKSSTEKEKIIPGEKPQDTAKTEPSHHRFGLNNSTHVINENKTISDDILKIAKPVDIKSFLPPGYKNTDSESTTTKSIDSILSKAKLDDLSAFLPPGYSESKVAKTQTTTTVKSILSVDSILKNTKTDDLSAFLPPGYKLPEGKTPKVEDILENSKKDDISSFLPPGFKSQTSTTTKKPSKVEKLFQNSKEDDISAFLPPGFKPKFYSTTSRSKPKAEDIFEKSKKDDISAFLPPGYKSKSFSTRKPASSKPNIEVENLPTSLLPSGYRTRGDQNKVVSSTEEPIATSSVATTTSTAKSGLKVVFPSRPGGKRINHKITTSKPKEEKKEFVQAPVPTIHKGWPTRATTEFTGWPTPSTTPISIEKLLESVQRATPTSTEPSENLTIQTTTQTPATTTTKIPRSTTPGVCVEECDLVGTIRLVDGVKWVPELLDRNTKEWQLLANEVQTQLEDVYTKSDQLRQLFKSLRIDGFTNGSVLVDYLVEMNNVNMRISTSEMKKLFNEALESTLVKSTLREAKSLNDTMNYEEKAKLGKFIIDPEYTDFIVVPKQIAPTVGYAEDNLLLPQWAIAVIVIGLASLLFVIIFGVTVLVNRSKNAKKKIPTPLTEDMLNELNKNHMGGYDNYGVEDPYSVEAGFWDPRRMDAQREYNRLPKKGSSGSIHDNSMTNLYDSWKSQWNGYYNNSTGGYYGNPGPGSSHRIYERRRSYDTNF